MSKYPGEAATPSSAGEVELRYGDLIVEQTVQFERNVERVEDDDHRDEDGTLRRTWTTKTSNLQDFKSPMRNRLFLTDSETTSSYVS